MANPFDKFDVSTENPFDKFDGEAKASPKTYGVGYQKYLDMFEHNRKMGGAVPGSDTSAKPKSYEEWESDKNKKYADVLLGIPDAAASVLSSIPAGLGAAAYAPVATASRNGKGLLKNYEDTFNKLMWKPKTDFAEDLLMTAAPIIGALPPVGSYLGSLRMGRRNKESTVDQRLAQAEQAKKPVQANPFDQFDGPVQLELEQRPHAPQYEATPGAWRTDPSLDLQGNPLPDTNIPFRADLSMEAQNLENPLQRSLWGDELPQKHPQEAPLGLTEALDNIPDTPFRGDLREQALNQLTGPIEASGELNGAVLEANSPWAGMGSGQRGAIDLEAVKEGLDNVRQFVPRIPVGEVTELPIETIEPAPPVRPQLSLVNSSKESQRGAINLGGQKRKFIEEATRGVIRAAPPTPAATLEAALAEGKDGKGSINLSAGSTLEAMKRNSALIQGGSRMVQSRLNAAEHNIRQEVFPFENAAKGLSRQELQDLGKVLLSENKIKQRYSAAEMADMGLNEKQLIAYQKYRDMMDGTLRAQNEARALQGKKPITAEEAYLSARWQGDFRMPFHDSTGKLRWYLAADSKRSLEKQASELMAQFPGELTPGEMSVVRSGKKRTDAQEIYTAMLDVLGRDDPAVAKIAAWMEEQTVGEGRKALGQEKHFKRKADVQGFAGSRTWNDPFKETLSMLQEQIQYAKNAHNWSALQVAGQDLKKVFADEAINQQQPNNVKYLKEYYANQLGFNELEAIKKIEDLIRDKTGVSPNAVGRGISGIKNFWITQKLLGAPFWVSNMMQAANTLPHLMDFQNKYGGNIVTSIPAGMLTGVAMAVGHTAKLGKDFYKQLGMAPGYDVFTARAMKYAEDNSVIARSIYDEAPIENSFSRVGQVARVANAAISTPETLLRSVAYMTYVNMLKSSGKFANDVDIFRLAEERVNASMADYRNSEKAMVFNKLGNFGNAIDVIMTYPINYYNQWSWALREAGKGNVLPSLTMLGVQGYLAGLMGVPGFAETDKLLELMKEGLAEHAPLLWDKVKDFSLKEMAINIDPAALYGPLSEQTGVALTSRAAAPIPSEMITTPGAPMVDLARQAGSVADALTSPMDEQKRAQALLNIAPTGAQGYLETGPLKDQTSVQREDGRVYSSTRDLAGRKGQYVRSPEEEALRAWGFRSQKEAVTRELQYAATKKAATAAEVVRKLPDKIYNELRKENLEKASDYIKLYANLQGTDITRQQLEKQLIEEFTTPSDRMVMRKNMPLETVLAVKRLNQLLDNMGYGNAN